MFPKEGELQSPTFLAWTRRQPCYFCNCPPPVDPHHWPPKGRGVVNDLNVVPACRACHGRCHGDVAVTAEGKQLPPIPGYSYEDAPAVMFKRFMRSAIDHEWQQVIREIDRWRDRPLAINF